MCCAVIIRKRNAPVRWCKVRVFHSDAGRCLVHQIVKRVESVLHLLIEQSLCYLASFPINIVHRWQVPVHRLRQRYIVWKKAGNLPQLVKRTLNLTSVYEIHPEFVSVLNDFFVSLQLANTRIIITCWNKASNTVVAFFAVRIVLHPAPKQIFFNSVSWSFKRSTTDHWRVLRWCCCALG